LRPADSALSRDAPATGIRSVLGSPARAPQKEGTGLSGANALKPLGLTGRKSTMCVSLLRVSELARVSGAGTRVAASAMSCSAVRLFGNHQDRCAVVFEVTLGLWEPLPGRSLRSERQFAIGSSSPRPSTKDVKRVDDHDRERCVHQLDAAGEPRSVASQQGLRRGRRARPVKPRGEQRQNERDGRGRVRFALHAGDGVGYDPVPEPLSLPRTSVMLNVTF
jgi:hypothetical protein